MFLVALSLAIAAGAFVLTERRARWCLAAGVGIAAVVCLAGRVDVVVPVLLLLAWPYGDVLGRYLPCAVTSLDRDFCTSTACYLVVLGMTLASFESGDRSFAMEDALAVIAFVVVGFLLLVGAFFVVASWSRPPSHAAGHSWRPFVVRGLGVVWLGLAALFGCGGCEAMVAVVGHAAASGLAIGAVALALAFLEFAPRVIGPNLRRQIAAGACGALPLLVLWSGAASVPAMVRQLYF